MGDCPGECWLPLGDFVKFLEAWFGDCPGNLKKPWGDLGQFVGPWSWGHSWATTFGKPGRSYENCSGNIEKFLGVSPA